MIIGFKTELHLNNQQKILLAKHVSVVCWRKAFLKEQNKLAKLQRQLSRKVKHSSNWYKAVVKLARQHRRVAFHVAQRNIRKDALHKLTTYLAKNHGIVVIEDLNVSGMLANHKLAKSVSR